MSIENSPEIDNEVVENDELAYLDEINDSIDNEDVEDDSDLFEETEENEDSEESEDEDEERAHKRKNGINKKFSKQSKMIKDLQAELNALKAAKQPTKENHEELKEPIEPNEDDYTIDEEDKFKSDMKAYQKAIREYDRKLAIKEYEAKQSKDKETSINESHEKRLEKAAKRYKDFNSIQNDLANVTSGDANKDIQAVNVIKQLEFGPDILYFFAKNKEEAIKIMKMPKEKMEKSIKNLNDKIEAKINKDKNIKPISAVKSSKNKEREEAPDSSPEAWMKYRMKKINSR